MYFENNICKSCLKSVENIKDVTLIQHGMDFEDTYKIEMTCNYRLELVAETQQEIENIDCVIYVPVTPHSYFDEDMCKLVEKWQDLKWGKTSEKVGFAAYNPKALGKLDKTDE